MQATPFNLNQLAAVLSLAALCAAIGCDMSLKPGDQLYALKNPTRDWKIPEKRPAIEVSASVEAVREQEATNLDTLVAALSEDPAQTVPSIYVDPPLLSVKRMRPDRSAVAKAYITSKEWQDFQLTDLSCSLDGLTWEMQPADEASLQQLDAKSGWLLNAQLPLGLEPGMLQGHSLTLKAQPTGAAGETDLQAQEISIPIQAQVLRRLAAYGDGIDETGTVHFGVLPIGIPYKKKLILKVHDSETKLKLQKVVARPSFVEVRMSPYGQGDDANHLYSLEVTLPATAPEHIARKEQLGNILLKFDHPRIHELNLKVDFVLHGRATSWRMANVDEYR